MHQGSVPEENKENVYYCHYLSFVRFGVNCFHASLLPEWTPVFLFPVQAKNFQPVIIQTKHIFLEDCTPVHFCSVYRVIKRTFTAVKDLHKRTPMWGQKPCIRPLWMQRAVNGKVSERFTKRWSVTLDRAALCPLMSSWVPLIGLQQPVWAAVNGASFPSF